LAFPGFVILGARFVRRHRDPLALGALFGAVVYVYGDVSGHYALGRVLPGIMLMAHTAMAVWVAELIARRPATRELRYAVAGVATVVVLGGIGSAAAVPRVVPRSVVGTNARHGAFASLVAPYEHLDHVISRDDVVVASHAVALGVAASSGKVIAPPAPAPFVTDTAARQGVVSTLLSPQTTEREFRALVEQYNVKWFVVLPSETADLAARLLDGDLHPELATKTLRIFRVVGPAGT
jgi:alpha-1,6-mannosyltransferase